MVGGGTRASRPTDGYAANRLRCHFDRSEGKTRTQWRNPLRENMQVPLICARVRSRLGLDYARNDRVDEWLAAGRGRPALPKQGTLSKAIYRNPAEVTQLPHYHNLFRP